MKVRFLAILALLCSFAVTLAWVNRSRTLSTAPVEPAVTSTVALPSPADATSAQQVSRSPATASALAWGKPVPLAGTKLVPDPVGVVTAQLLGHPVEGRVATLTMPSLLAMDQLKEGQELRLPLMDGEVAVGRVNLLMADGGGWLRAGGTLANGRGSFQLSSNGSDVFATVLLPDRQLAYEVSSLEDGRLQMSEKLLASVVCAPIPREPEQPRPQTIAAADAVAEAQPILSSRPSATAVLYLDFDGEVVRDSAWAGGATINAAPSALTSAQITEVWNRVKEDFTPFNIDVTTDIARYNGAPVGRRMRCIVTPTDTAAPGSGGVAYLRSFYQAGSQFSSTIPCWVFNQSVSGATEAISHELGHTFGLSHDGRTSPAEGYFNGHGSGALSWGPIMGAPYNRTITHWSKGEYASANNREDDIAIITNSSNGFGFAADEAGNSTATAASLNAPGGTINQFGIISQQTDADYYRFSTGGGTVTINANPAAIRPNLDILLQLLNSAGTVIAQSNPDTTLNASLSTSVGNGTFYVKVQGTGRADPLTVGYTAYGSLGVYSLSGNIPGGGTVQPPTITSPTSASGAVNSAFSYQITATQSPTSYSVVGSLPPGLSLNTASGLISGTPTTAGTYNVTVRATNSAGTGTAALTITIAGGFTLQAENAVLGGGTVVEAIHAGYSGSGYANSSVNGGTIRFNNVAGNGGGSKVLTIRYALGASGSRTCNLTVNSTTQAITFASSGAWTTWRTLNANITLTNSNTNTIQFTTTGADAGNIDQITVP